MPLINIGFMTGRGASNPAPTTLTFVGLTTASDTTVSFHASAAAGDLALIYEFFRGTDTTDAAVPTGWDQLLSGFNNFGSTKWAAKIYYKRLSASDISTGSVASNNTGNSAKSMASQIYTPDTSINLITAFDSAVQISTNPGAQTVSTSGQDTPSVVCGIGYNAAADPFSTESPTFANRSITLDGGNLWLGSTRYNSSPLDHTVDNGGLANTVVLGSGALLVS